MITFSGHGSRQRPDELRDFIALLRDEGVRSYLEIGACHGDTFHAVMSALPPGARGVAVDMPEGAWGKSGSRAALESAVTALRAEGYDASAIFGDSASAGVRQAVMTRGPYDAVLIDGDHRYAGVSADWRHYGTMARLVALHDIDGRGRQSRGMVVEVPRLWADLRARHRSREIIGAERGMGIGVLWL